MKKIGNWNEDIFKTHITFTLSSRCCSFRVVLNVCCFVAFYSCLLCVTFDLFCQQTKDALAIGQCVDLPELIACVTRMRNQKESQTHAHHTKCRSCQQKQRIITHASFVLWRKKQRRTSIAKKMEKKKQKKWGKNIKNEGKNGKKSQKNPFFLHFSWVPFKMNSSICRAKGQSIYND